MNQPPTVRLVLVGKTGSGKSSTGNTILGRLTFTAAVSRLSVTNECWKQKGEVFNREVTIVNTPGLFDTSQADDTVKREIAKCINMSAPGPHAILLIIEVRPFTAEERHAVRKVEEIFGEDAWKSTIVLFTYGDRVKSDFEQLVMGVGPELQEILNKVKKLEEEIKAVQSKYEKKLSEAQQEHQKVENRLQSELQEVKRYYHALKSRVRHVVEQTVPTDSIEDILKFHETLKLN